MCNRGTVKVLDQGEGDQDDAEFWAYFSDGTIGEASDDDDDVIEYSAILYQLSADPEAAPIKVAEAEKFKIGFAPTTVKLKKDDLNEGDIFLVDAGWELFCWMGRNADREEKLQAFSKSDRFAKEHNKMHLPLTIVKAGMEPSSFNQYFV